MTLNDRHLIEYLAGTADEAVIAQIEARLTSKPGFAHHLVAALDALPVPQAREDDPFLAVDANGHSPARVARERVLDELAGASQPESGHD